jgi:hypothetical protein
LNYDHVELTGFAKFNHFAPMAFTLMFPAMGIALPLIQPGGRDLTLFWVIGTPVAALAFWWSKRILRYQVIHTTQSTEKNYQAVLELATKLEWEIRSDRPLEFIQASVKGFPKTMASWGEMVTVAFLGGDVYINSICDPNERPSLTAFGRNLDNVEAVKRALGGPNP